MDSVHNIEEYPLVGRELCEVVNIHSLYFSQEVFVSHRAYAAGREWFKAVMGHYSANMKGVEVWFARDELEFEGVGI